MRTLLAVAAVSAASVLSIGVAVDADGRHTSTEPTVATTWVVAVDAPSGPYRPPVDAPVLDPFRAPATPYGPGNRGLEYATASATPARAIGSGVVAFAGQVAGRGVVTVEHPDGLRSSLTGLASIAVRAGDAVVGGQVLGTTAAVLHLGVRRGGEYIDPATLFGDVGPPRHAVLVPVP